MDNPVVMVNVSGTNQTWYYYYTDALGSVRLMTNASGTPVESYTYDPYGRPRVMWGGGIDGNWLTEDVDPQEIYSFSYMWNPIMFTGRWWDETTELYYYRFRDYCPTLGRFLQPDPLGYIDTMNLYAYCGNNPINWIDPWGTDYWVQGSLWGHRSFCVGNPNGAYFSYGFWPTSPNLLGGPGEIIGPYDNPGGKWKHRALVVTSSEKDSEIKDMMDEFQKQYNSLPPDERDGYYFGIYDCHSFGNQMYNFVNDNFGSDLSYDGVDFDINIPYP